MSCIRKLKESAFAEATADLSAFAEATADLSAFGRSKADFSGLGRGTADWPGLDGAAEDLVGWRLDKHYSLPPDRKRIIRDKVLTSIYLDKKWSQYSAFASAFAEATADWSASAEATADWSAIASVMAYRQCS